MKTVNVLTRKMGDFNVFQRTSDGYFDANSLLKQWNDNPDNTRRRLDDFMNSGRTKEFISALSEDESHRRKIDIGDNQLVIKVKGKTTKHGKTPDKVWINPRFEVQVLRFVHDQLIDYRDKAGDAYKRMSSALSKIIIVYGLHETMIRNSVGEEAKAKELMELEIDIAKMIEFGYITTEEQLRDYLYKVLRSKKALPL